VVFSGVKSGSQRENGHGHDKRCFHFIVFLDFFPFAKPGQRRLCLIALNNASTFSIGELDG
jgi:hypothetical protein